MKCAGVSRFIAVTCILAVAQMTLSSAPDAGMPAIPDDPSVVISTLPCGMHFYYVPGTSPKNMISMALVQIPDSTMRQDSSEKLARESMREAAFHELPLEKFLSSNGILPRKSGYFSTGTDIVYRLDSISLSRGETVLDSTLYAVFKIAGRSALNGIPPSSQALVVAGDIQYGLLNDKVQLLSMECPAIKGENHRKVYSWKDPEPGTWEMSVESENVSKIVAEWRDKRIPQQYMNTVLPAISGKLSQEFGWVLKNRLYSEFRSRGIFVWMDYRFVSSADSSGDEVSSLTVYCARSQTDNVKDIIGRELDRLFTYGVGEEEYCYCRDANRYSALRQETDMTESADREIRKCISHFLYGASLATGKELMKFEYREMPDSTQTRLFNNYLRKRLSVGSRADSSLSGVPVLVSRDSVRKALARYIPASSAKLPKDIDEYFSAGRKWSFPSGPIAIHKKTVSGGLVHYCYAVKGGSKWADSDYLNCIDGISAQALSLFLSAIGAKMNVKITPACVYFTGSVPGENFDTMVNVIAAISRQKENEAVFSSDRYKLFVTAGPVTYAQVKTTMAKYAGALGPGTDIAHGVDISDIADFKYDDGAAVHVPAHALSTGFPLDLSARNYALSRMARLILRDKVGTILSGSGCTARISCGFESYPLERYHIHIIPSDKSHAGELKSALAALSRETLDSSELEKYADLAKDEFCVFKSTPQFYINGVVKRYVDFKDLYSGFEAQTDKISAADLNAFFTAALENLR